MCAINGITRRDRDLVERMNTATRHRGPDGSHIVELENVTLGHNRLAIIDVSDAGRQPRTSNDGRFTIVFNGEIYNYRELRTELSTVYNFVSETDTEVLLAGYTVWGREVFPRLRGIFACALHDATDQSLLLVRDQLGVKPLYYRNDGASLTFSSELSGILAGITEPTLDPVSLVSYVRMHYTPSPQTLISGVSKLPPGHLLYYRDGIATIERYYRPYTGVATDVSHRSIYQTIDEAVHRQLISDRPVGVFLSGGLDSSIVLHHMAQHESDIRTFSIRFEMPAGAEREAGKFNADADLALRTARFYGTKHQTFTVSLAELRSGLISLMESVDEPIANPTVVSQYILGKKVRESGIVVALGGDGGDELFGGYTRHRAAVAAYLFQSVPHFLTGMLRHIAPRFVKLSVPLGPQFHESIMALPEKTVASIVRPGSLALPALSSVLQEHYVLTPCGRTPVDTFMRVDRETWLPDESLLRSDKTQMAHGIEYRVPLLDLDVVTLADHIGIFKKTWPNQGKRVLRSTYRTHLPEYLFNQPKRGWISPGAKWLRDPGILAVVQETCTSGFYSGLDGFIDWDAVGRMIATHVSGEQYALHPLWNVFQLQVFARKFKVRF